MLLIKALRIWRWWKQLNNGVIKREAQEAMISLKCLSVMIKIFFILDYLFFAPGIFLWVEGENEKRGKWSTLQAGKKEEDEMSRCEAWVLLLVSRGVETTRARSDFGLKKTSGEEFHRSFIYYSTQRNSEITSATFCCNPSVFKSCLYFNSVSMGVLHVNLQCVCFGHIAVMLNPFCGVNWTSNAPVSVNQ